MFVIDDNDKTTWRLQVKTAEGQAIPEAGGGRVGAKFGLSRAQLRVPQPIELFFMLIVRCEDQWRFLIVPRVELDKIRVAYVEAGKTKLGPGRRPVADDAAKNDGLVLEVVLKDLSAEGWGASLAAYLDRWPTELPKVLSGPGTRGAT